MKDIVIFRKVIYNGKNVYAQIRRKIMNQKDNSKKPKLIRIVILFLLIVLIATYIGYSYYIKNNGKEALKNEFFAKIVNHDLAFFMDSPIYKKIDEKLEKENYESNSNIKLATTMENNMFSQLDLSKLELRYDVIRNIDKNQYYSKINAQYSGNHVLTLDAIWNDEQFAVKSDEIVNRYVGINKSNTQNMINQLWERQVDLSTERKLKDFLVDREKIEFENIAKSSRLATYINLFKENVAATDFSKKENVIVTLDSEQISTTEYTVEIDSTETNQILQKLAEELSQDHELMSELVVSKVRDFENENNGVLDYSDNDNVSKIQGEGSNFNTSLNIWGENTATENIIPQNTISNETNSVNDSVENNVVTNNSTENTVPISNIINVNNVVEDNTNIENETNNTQEPETQQPIEQPIEQITSPDTPPENTQSPTNNSIEEQDNVRTQGFIAVNEETEDTDEENFIVGENYEETAKNIEKLAKKINWSSYLLSGAKANCSEEELAEILEEILRKKIEENNRLTVKMYVSENKVVKLNFELSESQESLDFEIISKSKNEKYLWVTALKGEENSANGYKVSFYQKKDDAVTRTKININKIQKNKINQKTNIDFETKGTINSKKYTTAINVVYSDNDGEFKIAVENSLNFDDNPEIEDLSEENCLFLDTLPNEELLLTRDAIKEKTIEVLREKNRNLNMIDVSNSNSIVQQIGQQSTNLEDENVKQQVKEILIQTLRNKMTEYLNNGTNLKIENLEGLEIPGYEVTTSISSNLAIITVNGYRFSLDSDFNLSDS